MKKLFIIIFVFLILIVGMPKNSSFTLLDYFSGYYTVYTSAENDNSVDLGFCYMNSKPIKENVVGESIKIENLEVADVVKTLEARIVKSEYLEEGITVIYAYTNLISKNVKVENQKVNLQIAINDNVVTIGWPLILGSF